MVFELSEAALSETFRNFRDGVRTLQNARSRNITHKRLTAETWMEAVFKKVNFAQIQYLPKIPKKVAFIWTNKTCTGHLKQEWSGLKTKDVKPSNIAMIQLPLLSN